MFTSTTDQGKNEGDQLVRVTVGCGCLVWRRFSMRSRRGLQGAWFCRFFGCVSDTGARGCRYHPGVRLPFVPAHVA